MFAGKLSTIPPPPRGRAGRGVFERRSDPPPGPSLEGRGIEWRVLVVVLALTPTVAAQTTDWPPAPALVPAAAVTPGALPPSVTAEFVAPQRWRCTFSFQAPPDTRSVALAGTFNAWSPAAMPLAHAGPDGSWSAMVELPAGVHQYKFVIDGDRWISDPQNPDAVPDGHSGQNSVLRLGRMAHLRESDAHVGDGRIDTLALEHRPAMPLYFQRLDGKALFRLRTLTHDVERVWLAIESGQPTEMTIADESQPFTLWETIAPLPTHETAYGTGQIRYTFVLADGPLRGSTPQTYGVPVSQQDIFKTPEWAKHTVWYQIMLDRFRNGDPTNDPEPVRPWTSEWFTPSPWEGRDGQTFYKHYVFDRFYGGDLAGLEKELPYLKKLGITAIYLMPIFKAQSNHKYNTTSYIHVDDHFGTKGDYDAVAPTEDLTDPATWQWTASDKLFLSFLKTAHAQGFKVIIDGVFNHVGTAHPAFQDVMRNGRASKYANWFNITSWKPFKYEGWAGFQSLPVFKKSKDGLASAAAKKHIFDITRRWMDPDGDGDRRDGIDGWRLDVPNEIAAPFWVEWRQLVKSINPDAYISGEIWDRADTWLDGRHFDAVMNYEFARPTTAWIFNRQQRITPSEIDQRLRTLRLAYPLEATLVLQNLVDSHDTDRAASMALNPDRPYNEGNRPQLPGVTYDNRKPGPAEYARVRLAALLQMTYVGAPMIWYGDEAGMWGAADPTGRKPMLWEDLEPYEKPEENFVMRDQLAYYRQIIALRNAHPALQTGSIQTLLTDDDAEVWAFVRRDDDEQLVVILNDADRAHEVTVPLPLNAPAHWTAVLGAEGRYAISNHRLHLRVPPISGVILHAATLK
jgi:cyclomaltodextrinase